MSIQRDLFAAPSNRRRHLTAAPADPLHGLAVQLSDCCQCGSHDAVIGEARGRITHPCFVTGVKDIAVGWQTKRTLSLRKLSKILVSQRHRSEFNATKQIGRDEDKA